MATAMKQEQKPEQGSDKNRPPKKPMSDFLLGLILFIVFIIFMALWLHFQLPETKVNASNPGHSSNMDLAAVSFDDNSLIAHTVLGRAQGIISF